VFLKTFSGNAHPQELHLLSSSPYFTGNRLDRLSGSATFSGDIWSFDWKRTQRNSADSREKLKLAKEVFGDGADGGKIDPYGPEIFVR
jgi:hypothetical protein